MRRVGRMTPVAAVETCTATWHGTGWAYAKYRCRCPAARVARKSQWHVHYGRSYGGNGLGGRGVPKHHDVDPVAVERGANEREAPAVRGRLGSAERAIIVAQLTATGLSAARIAQRIGIAPRSVTRIRARLGLTS